MNRSAKTVILMGGVRSLQLPTCRVHHKTNLVHAGSVCWSSCYSYYLDRRLDKGHILGHRIFKFCLIQGLLIVVSALMNIISVCLAFSLFAQGVRLKPYYSSIMILYISVMFLWAFALSVGRTSSMLLHFGTKTPYHPNGDLQSMATPAGCRAVHLNMVIRHGSRYPSGSSKKTLYDLLKNINQLHESKPYKYKNLTLPWNLPQEYHTAAGSELSVRGSQELYHIAKRFRAKFPLVFNSSYWNKYYRFVTSDKQRTARSASSFGYGLFQGKGILGVNKYQPIAIIFSGPKDKDKVLRYYDTCPRYNLVVEDGKGMEEWQKFGVSDAMKTVIQDITERLQLKGKMELSADSVQKLFWLCAFDTMNNENRDWCSVFTKKDVEVMNYYADLEQYYSHSYGNAISYKTNCPLVADITNSLKAFVTQNQSYPYGIFRFTHSGTMTALQTILGMYNDSVPLKANNFAEQKNRKFRISTNVPMAANMAFVLYKCDKMPTHRVQILMNEKPAVLPCCGSICSLQTFLSCYEAIGKNCDFDRRCKIPSAANVSGSSQDKLSTSVSVMVVMLLVLFL